MKEVTLQSATIATTDRQRQQLYDNLLKILSDLQSINSAAALIQQEGAGTYGDATNIPQIVVDSNGNITGITNIPIVIAPAFITAVADTLSITLTETAGTLTADLRKQNSTTVNLSVDAGGLKADVTSVPIAKIGTPDVDTLQEYIDCTGSAGYFSGGTITNAGGGSVDIAAGKGLIRATTTNTDPLYSFEWVAFPGVAIPADTARYVFIDYNGGAPTYVLSASEFDEDVNKILIGVAINEGGTIESVFNVGVRLDESIGQAGRYLRRVDGISRDKKKGGLIVSETGTRNVKVTAGVLWWGRTEYPFALIDTSIAGSFDSYYYNGAAWVQIAAQTQWDNTQYNDITSGLVVMTAAKWAIRWWYIEADGHLIHVFGRNQYNTQALAELESPPSSLPNRLQATGTLCGRFVFQKSAATAAVISSAFDTQFVPTSAADITGIAAGGDLAGTYPNPTLATNLKNNSMTITLDGGGAIIPTGRYGGLVTCPYSGTITGWDMFEGSSPQISTTSVIDIWKDTYANVPPTVADTIWGTKPNLAAGTKNTATGLSIPVTAGDVFAVNLDSNNNAKLLNLILKITKT